MPSSYKCTSCGYEGFPETTYSVFGGKNKKCPQCKQETMVLTYRCDECGYEGDHFKLTFFDAISSYSTLSNPVLNLEQKKKICPNCGRRSILDVRNQIRSTSVIKNNAEVKKSTWTTKKIITTILIVFVLVVIAFFISIYLS